MTSQGVKSITIKDLTYGYEKKRPILQNVSIDIFEQSIVTILGRNGIGKSTFLNCLLGFNNNYQGEICYFGKEQKKFSRKEFAQMVAFVPQLCKISFDYTVENFILMGFISHMDYFSLPNADMKIEVESILRELGIINLKHRMVNELSGGEKQLIYIARALAQRPKIVILDEPTSALDFGNTLMIIDALKQLRNKGITIVMTSHNPDFAFELQSVVIAMMPNNEIISGNVEDVLSNKLLTDLYGVPIKRVLLPMDKKYVCIKDIQ